MKIISHRGARGLETENTLESLKAGMASGADRVEFDVWTCKDGVPVLLHDADFYHVAGIKKRVFDMDYSEIKKIKTLDGKKIITAQQALKTLKDTPAYFEIKDYYLSNGVVKALREFKGKDIWVGSNNHRVIQELQRKHLGFKLFAATVWHPVETMHFLRKNKLHGMSLHYRWFNMFIYIYCRRHKIDLILYTINSPWALRHLNRFYPELIVVTDHPARAVKLLR